MKDRKAIAALFFSALMVTLSACDNDGPFEETGEEIEEGVENTSDAIEDSTDGG